MYTLNVNDEIFSEDYSGSVGNYSSELPLYLFALSRENNGVNNRAPANTRCYYLKIWQDGALVRDYRPCLHDGVVALYDMQNDAYAVPAAGTLISSEVTITSSDPKWGAALTVGYGETMTIDAGDSGVWNGSITVNDGGTLKTQGTLSVLGATTVNPGGTLDIESGEAYFAFGSKTAKGVIFIRQGATLDARCEDGESCQSAFMGFEALLRSAVKRGDSDAAAKWERYVRHALDMSLTYMVSWDIPTPEGSDLFNHAFRATGWMMVSPQNQCMDCLGAIEAPATWRMGVYWKDRHPSRDSDAAKFRGVYRDSWEMLWMTAIHMKAGCEFMLMGVDW